MNDWSAPTCSLGDWLGGHADQWRRSPFDARERESIEQAWSPRLRGILTSLSEEEVLALLGSTDEGQALRRRLAPAMPELADVQHRIDSLVSAPGSRPAAPPVARIGAESVHAQRDVSARKLSQIDAFLDAVGPIEAPAVDWCAGKGHLGRIAALREKVDVSCLERDAALCRRGAELARRDGATLRFSAVDVLSPAADQEFRGRHLLALHACGHLHRRLVADAGRLGARALDVAPCCHDRGTDSTEGVAEANGFHAGLADRRLAVTGHATASVRERRQFLRQLGWQCAARAIASRCWGAEASALPSQRSGAPRAGSFAEWLAPVAARHGVVVPTAAEVDRFEADGRAEAWEILRASLPRLAFQRPLEVWLVGGLAARLESQGFEVRVRRFCEASLTPRNLLISARRQLC